MLRRHRHSPGAGDDVALRRAVTAAIDATMTVWNQIPVPVTETVWAPAPLAAVTFTVEVFAPVVVGLKTTLIVQLPPTATDVPHVLVCENWPALAPVSVMLVTGTTSVPMFVTVTVCAALATPTAWLANARAFGPTV